MDEVFGHYHGPETDPQAPDISFPSAAGDDEDIKGTISGRELAAQASRERASQALSDEEERKGFKELVSTAFGVVPEHLQGLANTFIDAILHTQAGFLATQLREYLDKVGDKYLDKATEWVVASEASRLQTAFDQHPYTPARDIVSAAAHELAIDGATMYAALAERLVSNPLGLPDTLRAGSVDVKCVRSLAEKAKRLVRQFGSFVRAEPTPGSSDPESAMRAEAARLDALKGVTDQIGRLESRASTYETTQALERAATVEGAREVEVRVVP